MYIILIGYASTKLCGEIPSLMALRDYEILKKKMCMSGKLSIAINICFRLR